MSCALRKELPWSSNWITHHAYECTRYSSSLRIDALHLVVWASVVCFDAIVAHFMTTAFVSSMRYTRWQSAASCRHLESSIIFVAPTTHTANGGAFRGCDLSLLLNDAVIVLEAVHLSTMPKHGFLICPYGVQWIRPSRREIYLYYVSEVLHCRYGMFAVLDDFFR